MDQDDEDVIDDAGYNVSSPSKDSIDDDSFSLSSSSAQLREKMENQRRLLISIQKDIRSYAEKGETESMGRIVEQRTKLANDSLLQAKRLLVHTNSLLRLQQERQTYFLKMCRKLDRLRSELKVEKDIQDDSKADVDGAFVHCSWSEWNSILSQLNDMISKYENFSVNTDSALKEFTDTLRYQAQLCYQISNWVDSNIVYNKAISYQSSARKLLDIKYPSADKILQIDQQPTNQSTHPTGIL